MVITSDGSYRGNKAIDLKGIVDEALEKCPSVETVLVVKRTNTEVTMKEGRDLFEQIISNGESKYIEQAKHALNNLKNN